MLTDKTILPGHTATEVMVFIKEVMSVTKEAMVAVHLTTHSSAAGHDGVRLATISTGYGSDNTVLPSHSYGRTWWAVLIWQDIRSRLATGLLLQ